MNWLDSFDDCLNPITVRELRSVMRRFECEVMILFVYLTIIVGDTFVLFEPKFQQDVGFTSFVISVIPVVSTIGSVFVGLDTYILLQKTRFTDEVLNIVPLSPRQQVHGYWAYSSIGSLLFNSICLPFIAIGQIVGPAPYVLLLVPLGTFFISQITILICISFSARVKQKWECVLSGLINICLFPGLTAAFWCYVICFASSRWQTLVWNQGFGFVSLFVLLPITLLLLGYIAYRLSIYGFKTWRKPFWRSLLLNIVIYTLFSIIVAILWFGLAALVL
jgi:hypothetical protein